MNEIKRPRLLIVDDEPVMRTITQSVLTQHEFEVDVAECGEDALARMDMGERFDLILLDVMMPGMDGFEVCRRLRREVQFEHLPVIMLTALDDQASIDEAYRCGATDFITKPLNMPLLPHRVRYLLRSAQAFKELMDSQETLINTQHIAQLGNWFLDGNGTIVSASRQYLDLLGVSSLPVTEWQMLARVHREDRITVSRARAELRVGRPYRLDYRLRNPVDDNKWIHVNEMGFPRQGESGEVKGGSGFTQDITQRVEQEERIRHMAWHDALTGLKNRHRLLDLMERELSGTGECQPLAVLFVHANGLRQISSVFGQERADAAIKVLAGRLKGILECKPTCQGPCNCGITRDSAESAILSRYDEHSFVIAVPGSQQGDAIRSFAEGVVQTCGQPMMLQGEEVMLKIFIGVTYYPEDASDAAELLRRAMLVAVQAARSDASSLVAFFDPERDREAARRLALERGLRLALEQGNQLLPYFQPKVRAADGQLMGAEVLLRWAHPEMGLVPPGQFIPLAEETGLIHPISDWLMGHVCDWLADWRAMDLDVGLISINLTADSFFDSSLCTRVDEILIRTGVKATQLVIELTESVLMRDSDMADRVISGLRERGVRISLDDFGTGYSSLGYLHRFPIDEIKIDRSFIVNLEAGDSERALVRAIIDLGHALGLKVVAEGVETTAQADLLRAMGCDIFQGYLFARPMPAADFARYCAEGRGA